MAFTSDYLKINIYGTVAGGDVWNTGLYVRTTLSAGSWGLDNLNTLSGSIDTLLATWWTTWKAVNSSSISWTGHKLYAYPQSGGSAYLSVDKPTATPVAGTGGNAMPLFTSLCSSLRSNTAGRHGRGRMYVPATGLALTAGQVAAVSLNTYNGATKTLIDALNAADWSAYNVTNKRVTIVSHSSATFYDVARILLDSKPDVQHRRDNRIPANATDSKTVA